MKTGKINNVDEPEITLIYNAGINIQPEVEGIR